jgi:hypothetical protein
LDSIKIGTGEKHIAILDENDNPKGEIVFNPSDVLFAEKFYAMYGSLQDEKSNIEKRAIEIDSDKTLDVNGIPANMQARINLYKDINTLFRSKIDDLFGAGISKKMFGDTVSFDMEIYKQFLEGVMPYIQTVRAEKVAQYSSKTYRKRVAK